VELLSKGGLGENTAWEIVAPIVDVKVKSVELIEVGFPHRAQDDGIAFEHDFLLSQSTGAYPCGLTCGVLQSMGGIGTKAKHFAGTDFEPRKLLKNAPAPTLTHHVDADRAPGVTLV
jgi:hypothetical protein